MDPPSLELPPPIEEMSLDGLEDLAMGHLRVLLGRGNPMQLLENDTGGAFMLLLACCSDHDMTSWFIRREGDLYSSKLREYLDRCWRARGRDILSEEACAAVFKNTDVVVSVEGSLVRCSCHWTKATALVKDSAVNMKKGEATFIPHACNVIKVYAQEAPWLMAYHTAQLSLIQQVMASSFFIPRLKEDLFIRKRWLPSAVAAHNNVGDVVGRIRLYLERLLKDESNANNQLLGSEIPSLETLDATAAKHFPPCMQHLLQHLRSEHLLRHWGRFHLLLFLKEVKLPMNDIIELLRSELVQLGPRKFNEKMQHYTYGVRHAHGLEGKMCSYSAYSCQQIITTARDPAPDAHQGCPLAHWDEQALRHWLPRFGVSDAVDMEDIVQRRGPQPQDAKQACRMLFEKRSGCCGSTLAGKLTPTAWFMASVHAARASGGMAG
ncbi:unnamed protein product [Chrysoparadoxa australica]